MPKRVEKLSLRNFRGATCPVEVEFDASKPITMIFGENGTGKSTFVDAIDFVCNQKHGSLSDKSSTSPKAHLPSLGSKARDIDISLVYDSQTWSGSLGTQGPQTTGPDGRPVARVLRRSQILQLINEQPKKRYGILQSFITVPNIEKSEQALRDAAKTVGQDFNEAVRATQQAREAVEKFWQDEGCPGVDPLKWAQDKAKEDPATLQSQVAELTGILEALHAGNEAQETLDNTYKEQINLEQKYSEINEALIQRQKGGNEQEGALIPLLQEVQRFLQEKSTVTDCPVCERHLDGKDLHGRVSKRLSDMDSLVSLKKQAENAQREVSDASAKIQQVCMAFTTKVQTLTRLVKTGVIADLVGLVVDWLEYPKLLDASKDMKAESLEQQARAFLAVVKDSQALLINRRNSDQKILNQLNAIKGHSETFTEKAKATDALDHVSKRLSGILQVIEKQRKAYVEGILADISGLTEKLYQKVHPHENIGKMRFFLRPNVVGSLEFAGQFQEASEIQPQAYYSESHLDTLGVCVFLSLAKHFNDENTIIVLDDVLTSVDDIHLERFIQMLHDEASSFNQVIITTHYRSWRDRYRFARGPSGNVQLIELLHWSLSRGIQHTKTKLSVDELHDWMRSNPLERQIVASKAGILLESLLDHIALRYRCKLPRQAEPNYTLGDLVSSIDSKLSKALKIKKTENDPNAVIEIPLQGLINEISEMGWVRNQVGCHFSLPGMGVSDTEVTLFAERVTKLAEALVCRCCGELPWRNRSGSFWECRCRQTELHPLTTPGGVLPIGQEA